MQSQKFMETDRLWWKGLARIMEAKGYIKQMDSKVNYNTKARATYSSLRTVETLLLVLCLRAGSSS